MFGSKTDHLVLAGDDDQAIYNFLGVCSRHFQNFVSDQDIVLDVSHRLPSNILKYALDFAQDNIKVRKHKVVRSNKLGGDICRINILDFEGSLLKELGNGKEVSILTRCQHQLLPNSFIKNTLNNNFISWKNKYSDWVIFNKYSENKTLRALQSLHDMLQGEPVEYSDLRRVISILPSRKFFRVGAKALIKEKAYEWENRLFTINDLKNWIVADAYINIVNKDFGYIKTLIKPKLLESYEKFIEYQKSKALDRYKCDVGTIHSVKGGEYQVVFLFNNITNKIRGQLNEGNQEYVDDESRIWFVGLTRAWEKLYIVEVPNGKEI